jgi:hypothetical protein
MILDGNSGVAAVATKESINGQDGDEGVGMLVLESAMCLMVILLGTIIYYLYLDVHPT